MLLENICYATFTSKLIETIKFLSSFNKTNLISILMSNKYNFVTSTVVYNPTAPITSKMYSFNDFVSDLDIDDFPADAI